MQHLINESIGRKLAFGSMMLEFSDWMTIARAVLSFLRNAERHTTSSTRRLLKSLEIDEDALQSPAVGLPFEFLGPADRAKLLGPAGKVMTAGLERLTDAFRRESLPASMLPLPAEGASPSLLQLADALKPPIHRIPGCISERPDRSQTSVLREWLRLKRRMRRSDSP